MNLSTATLKQVLEVNIELETERLAKETNPKMKRVIEQHIRSMKIRLEFDLDKYLSEVN